MPKAYRGGKGRTEKPLTDEEKEFDEIDRTKNGIAVIKVKEGIENTKIPLYSNSKDTVYFALDAGNNKHAIGIYKDYQLQQTIDYDKRGEHYHNWGNPKNVRGKLTLTRDNIENFNLTSEHRNLISQFNDWWDNRD